MVAAAAATAAGAVRSNQQSCLPLGEEKSSSILL